MVILLFAGTRLSELRMAEVRCVILRGPILLLRKDGDKRQKLWFFSQENGIQPLPFRNSGDGLCGLHGQKVRLCYQIRIICPTQRGGEFPKSNECFFFSPQCLDFLPKCCSLEITRTYSLNSLACLLLTCPEVFCTIAPCSNAEMQLCLCSDSQSDGTFSE